MNQDLTVGKPSKVLWKFCLPLFASVIFQQFYNLADSLVAGKFIGENALAAVGNSYEITLIFLAFAFGCNMGCSILVSEFFGAKKYDKVKTCIYTSIISTLVVCIVLMLIGILGCDLILNLIKTPSEVFTDSKVYLDIYVYSLPFVFFYNVATGIFSALGDSKTPFIFLAISSTVNIAMDVLFVASFNMGVAGVAWATFICQGISCILALLFVFKRLSKFQSEKAAIFDKHILKRFVIIALPSTLQQSFVSVGNIIVQGIINGFGASVMAGYSAIVKINGLVITSYTTIGNGMSNYVAQNMGARKLERVKEGFIAGMKMVWTITIPIVIFYLWKGDLFLNLFLDNGSAVSLDTGLSFIRIVAPFYFVISAKLIGDGILRGAGLMKQFMIDTFVDLGLRVICALVLAKFFGVIGVWLAWPIGWCISTFITLYFYRRGPWYDEI